MEQGALTRDGRPSTRNTARMRLKEAATTIESPARLFRRDSRVTRPHLWGAVQGDGAIDAEMRLGNVFAGADPLRCSLSVWTAFLCALVARVEEKQARR